MTYATVDTVEFKELGVLDREMPARKRFFVRVLEVPLYGRDFKVEDQER